MKKSTVLTMMEFIGFITPVISQVAQDVKYRRSSLHTMLVEGDKFPNKEVVEKAFANAPFPDKYNDHNIGQKTFDPAKYPLTKEEQALYIKEPSKAAKMAANAAGYEITTEMQELPYKIKKFLEQEKVGNKIVAKWFNRATDGSFDMSMIQERGFYNASEMEANIAKGSARGTASIADAGIELLGNTFVVVSRFNYVSNEVAAAKIRDAAVIAANALPAGQAAGVKAAEEVYNRTKEGYSVWATSYLYKLVWNDSVEAVFYNDLWMDKSNSSAAKKAAFDNSNLFKLEFVGDEKAVGLVTFSGKEKRTEAQIIELATVRVIDAVYAKLQKKYDVFKVKTPLYSGEPITSKIGMKEGLEGGEKFEVLEQTLDPKTGLTKYVSKGTIVADKALIWDNRYNAGEAPAAGAIDRTTFKGGKKFSSGMLIREIK